MGIELVKVVAGSPTTSRLSGNAYKVLIAMSLHALDKPKDGRPAGLYFAGWAPLQIALGYDAGGPETKGHTAVKRAVRELREGKHITAMVTAARGTRQSYLVHPGGMGKGVTSDPQSEKERGSLSDPKRGSLSDPKRGSLSDPNGGHSATLLGHIEEGRGLMKDEITHPATSTTDRGATTSATKDVGSIGQHKHEGASDDFCGVCGLTFLNLVHARARRRSA